MPTIALYIPAKLYQAYGQDAARMRKIALEALRAELSEGENRDQAVSSPTAHPTGMDSGSPSESYVSLTSVDDPMRGKPTQQVVELDDDHFKPDFKGEGKKKR